MPSLKNKRKPELRGKSKKTNLRKTKKSMNKRTSRRGRRVHVGGVDNDGETKYNVIYIGLGLTEERDNFEDFINSSISDFDKIPGQDELTLQNVEYLAYIQLLNNLKQRKDDINYATISQDRNILKLIKKSKNIKVYKEEIVQFDKRKKNQEFVIRDFQGAKCIQLSPLTGYDENSYMPIIILSIRK